MEASPKEKEKDGKEKQNLRSRVKIGLRRVSARFTHPVRTASEPYGSSGNSSSDEALHTHMPSPSTSTSSSSERSMSCGDVQLARKTTPARNVRSRVVSLSKLLSPSITAFPLSGNDCADKDKPSHTPRKLKKRSRTASAVTYASGDYMSFSAINTPATPPGDLLPQDRDVDGLDPFLVDDADESQPVTPALSPMPALAPPLPTLQSDSRDMTPSHELELSSPPPASLLVSPELNVDKPVPPPPAAESDASSEEETAAPAVYLPQLVLPTMFLPIPNTDPLSTLLTKYIADERRRPPRDVSGDYSRADFHTLVMTNSWRAIARLARDRLVQTDPEDLDRVFNLWYLRLSSLARMRLFNQTTSEAANLQTALAHLSQTTFERIVPFELQVLFARTAYWAGSASEYADALGVLLKRCRMQGRRARHAADRTMWRERGARLALIAASRAVEVKDYAGALALLEPLLSQPDFETPTVDAQGRRHMLEVGWELRSAVARVYLQAGLVDEAEKALARAAEVPGAPENSKAMGRALVACARGEWKRTEELLDSIVSGAEREGDEETKQGAREESFAAVNDLAVALLAQGKIKTGIDILERALKQSPGHLAMAEPFLFNLSTLYELRSAVAADKKRELLLEVAKWSGDGLRVTCLKLPTS